MFRFNRGLRRRMQSVRKSVDPIGLSEIRGRIALLDCSFDVETFAEENDSDKRWGQNWASLIVTWGRFHQSFFAKRKFAGAQLAAKNSPFNFTNILPQTAQKFAQFVSWNLPNLCAVRQMLCAVCQTLCAVCQICVPKKASHPVRAKMSGTNVDEIDPCSKKNTHRGLC